MATVFEYLDGSRATTRGPIVIAETNEGLVINTGNRRSQHYLQLWQNQRVVRVTSSKTSEIVDVTGQKGLKQISFVQSIKLTKVLLDQRI